jgi:Na+-transporting NADH:ubiquinone oxidoreductase subunit C
MKSFSNTYIFIFSTVMVVMVATLLSFVAGQLKPLQEKNVEIEKKLDLLRSVGIARDVSEVKDKDSFVEQTYEEEIARSFVINARGEEIEGIDAFGINLKAELAKDLEERNLPVYVHINPEGEEVFIMPMRGKGLWGPIWGYVSFEPDLSTIYGAIFSHAKETPGLGAEIDQLWFQEQFFGKAVFNEAGEFVSVAVIKGGAGPDDPHAVDGVSGGTITSVALQEMMMECLGGYQVYMKENRN